ncbi:MAG: pyrroline-5-carboxylate reductase [Clostridiales bacterium]|jgi:pyrroline-5-carboxylate reductase|nr:pyrroline-5-carboxylate reductase [Clostridiales bacterium]
MKTAIIGGGNMGGAIIRGMIGSGQFLAGDIVLLDSDAEKCARFAEMGVEIVINVSDLTADVVILAIKPGGFRELLAQIADNKNLCDNAVFVSIAAGISTGYIMDIIPTARVVRAMPNLSAQISMGVTAVCRPSVRSESSLRKSLSDTDFADVLRIFSSIGTCVEISEEQMPRVVALNGSSPAFVFMLIDAMIAQGAASGFDEETAKILACNTIIGAAKMAGQSDSPPRTLCKNVCSPNGTTIEGVKVLENGAFNALIIDAMDAVTARAEEMEKNAN